MGWSIGMELQPLCPGTNPRGPVVAGSLAVPQLSGPSLVEVPAVESSGFSFPYYLYTPKELSRSEPVRLLIEPNNTGQAGDDFEVHRASAKRTASAGSVRRLADRLQAPLLVPVFPRPGSQWKIYTHYLDRDS